MPSRIDPNDWQPCGIKGLEENALKAVRSMGDTLVDAGPGAGKTELLAQRACYLLQTGICPTPKRILAISFKRDAARNLRERVKERCSPTLSHRFDSLTFDSFSKSLLDRFRRALPPAFAVQFNYQIDFKLGPRSGGQWVRENMTPTTLTADQLAAVGGDRMYKRYFAGRPLSCEKERAVNVEEMAAAELWKYLLRTCNPAVLNFNMIGRLAELILQTNPLVLFALRSTYTHVFLDEFQDTSGIHYDLTRTAFMGSTAVLTAVGDNKQRVNKWAGALDGVFDSFKVDFCANGVPLLMNYRSSPRLIQVQSVFAKAIDPQTQDATWPKEHDTLDGECRALEFEDYHDEASHIAELIHGWITKQSIPPREVCILCRQLPAVYAQELQERLAEKGIASRPENELQDLVSEPVTTAILNILRLLCHPKAPQAWQDTIDLICALNADSEEQERQRDGQLKTLLSTLKSYATGNLDAKAVKALVDSTIEFFGSDELRAFFPQYSQGTFFDETIDAIVNELVERTASTSLGDAIDDLEGAFAIPIMTMHKSKGLEYHTVIFIGLEDNALWGYEREPKDETCGFFVALSRAKQRAVFTFSGSRPDKKGNVQRQSRSSIKKLYQLLSTASVQVEKVKVEREEPLF